MERKISLCMITLGEPTLLRAIESALPCVDEVVLIDTRPDRSTPLGVPQTFGRGDGTHVDVHVYPFDWIKDFSAARQFSFDKASYPYCLWLDSDETLIGAAELRSTFLAVKPDEHVIYCRTDYEKHNGKVLMAQMRERIVPREYGKWMAPIHEVWMQDVMMTSIEAPAQCYVDHDFEVTDPKAAVKRDRNLDILRKAIEVENPDRRLELSYAMACIAEKNVKEAERILRVVLPKEPRGWPKYRSYLLLARCAAIRGSLEQIACAAAMAHEQVPSGIEAYRLMFEVAVLQERWHDAMLHFEQGFESGKRQHDMTMWMPQQADTPYTQGAIVAIKLGLWDKAKEYADKSDNVELIAGVTKALKHERLAKVAEELIEELPADARPTLAQALPECVKDFPWISKYTDDPLPEGKLKIAIHCGMEGMGGGIRADHWGPDDLAVGIGGSEEMAIRVAPALVKAGAFVEVFGPWTKEQVKEGVKWTWYENYNAAKPYDVFIYWRYPGLVMYAPEKAYKVLWLHDAIESQYCSGIELADEVWVLSRYHEKWIKGVYPKAPTWITRNGVPSEEFPPVPEKEDGRIVYANSPDRGLDILLDWWPEIQARIPNGKLHIYYGFNQVFMRRIKDGDPIYIALKAKIEKAVAEDPSIVWHGSIGQADLHKELGLAKVWAYPTEFNEISCITAMKMQAMGVIPVCARFASLNETVVYGVPLGDAWKPDIRKYKEEFIQSVVNMEKIPGDAPFRREMAQAVRDTFGMASLAQSWVEHLNERVALREPVTV